MNAITKLAIKNYLQVVASKLPPVKLKGNNHAPRVRMSSLVHSANMSLIRVNCPLSQMNTVSIYRGRGFGGNVEFVSKPVADGIRKIISELE